jgi:hypothetical protein
MNLRSCRLLAVVVACCWLFMLAAATRQPSVSDSQIHQLRLEIYTPQGPQIVPASQKIAANGSAENGGVCATDVKVIIYGTPPSTVEEQPDSGAYAATVQGDCTWAKDEVGTAGCDSAGTWANECVAWAKYPGDSNYTEWTSSLFRGMCANGLVGALVDPDLNFTEPRGKRAIVRVTNPGDESGRVRASGTAEKTLKLRAVKGKVFVPDGTHPLTIPLDAPRDARDGTVNSVGNKTRWVIEDLPGAKCSDRKPFPRSFVVVWYQTQGQSDFKRWLGSGFGGVRVVDP